MCFHWEGLLEISGRNRVLRASEETPQQPRLLFVALLHGFRWSQEFFLGGKQQRNQNRFTRAQQLAMEHQRIQIPGYQNR